MLPRGVKRIFRLTHGRKRAEDAVEAEFQHHLECRVDELVAEGWHPEEARRRAESDFGERAAYRAACVAQQRREARMTWWKRWIEDLLSDVGYAFRSMTKAPGFAAAVVLTLGLGIGANTAIFTVVDAVLLKPLPFAEPEELVEIAPRSPEGGYSLPFWYAPAAWAWEEWDGAEGVVLTHGKATRWHVGDQIIRPAVYAASWDMLLTLGVEPILGRGFAESDATPGAPPVALLSQSIWERHFGGDPGVLGRTIEMEGRTFTVVGVLPRSFRFPRPRWGEIFTVLGADARSDLGPRDRVEVVARLTDDLSPEAAEERAAVLAGALVEAGTGIRGFDEAQVAPLGAWRANPRPRRSLWVLTVAVAALLLVALFNAVNLVLVRSSARSREIGVRLALGGSRLRVLVQLLVESTVLAFLAGALAVLAARIGVDSILALSPGRFAEWSANPIIVGERVVAFVFGLSFLSALAIGLVPGWMAVRGAERSVGAAMNPHVDATVGRSRWRTGLVVVEVALSVALLVGAGLLMRSFITLNRVDPGFEADRILQVGVELAEADYPTAEARRTFAEELRESLAALPGVSGVTLASGLPPGTGFSFGVTLEAEGGGEGLSPEFVPSTRIDRRFLEVMGIDMVRGRSFRSDDPEDVAIIDTDLARGLWGSADPLGRRFRVGEEGPWKTVIGVVQDPKLLGPDDRAGPYDILYPLATADVRSFLQMGVRTEGDPAQLVAPVRRAIRELDPDQVITTLAPSSQALADSMEEPRFVVVLMSTFAVLALTLGALGLYSVLAFAVRRRFRELGIRVALGAGRSAVRGMVLRQGMGAALLGVVLGLGAAALGGRFLESLLFQVETSDVLVQGIVAGAMLLVAGAASYLPARRATRVDPVEVLRAE